MGLDGSEATNMTDSESNCNIGKRVNNIKWGVSKRWRERNGKKNRASVQRQFRDSTGNAWHKRNARSIMIYQ